MTMTLRNLMLFLHLLGAIMWIGGMLFAYFCLRPAAVDTLDPPQRLPLWAATFKRFLPYTAVAVVVMLISGFTAFSLVGFKYAPLGWHIMMMLGLVMTGIFGYVYLALYPRLHMHCAASAWPIAAQVLNSIRRLVATNLVLGVCVVAAAIFSR